MRKKQIEYMVNKRQKELEKQNKQQQLASQSSSGNYQNSVSKVNMLGKGVSGVGNAIQNHSTNPKFQNFGKKLTNFGNSVQSTTNNMLGKPQINNMMNNALTNNAPAPSASSAVGSTVNPASTTANTAGNVGSQTASNGASSASKGFGVPWMMIAGLIMKNFEKTKQRQKEYFNNTLNTAKSGAENNLQQAKGVAEEQQQDTQEQLNEEMLDSLTPMAENTTNYAVNPNKPVSESTNVSDNQELIDSIFEEYQNPTSNDTESENQVKNVPVEQTIPQQDNSALVSELMGNFTGGAAPIQNESIPQDTQTQQIPRFVTGENSVMQDIPHEQTQPVQQDSTAKNIFNEFLNGYKENRSTPLRAENLKRTDKSGWNRLGEAVGTTGRVLSKPVVQGALAGTVYGAYHQNPLLGLGYGVKWAQNKAKSDMYNKMINGDNAVNPIIGADLGAQDYNTKISADNQIKRTDIEQDKALEHARHNQTSEAIQMMNAQNNTEYRNQMLALRKAEIDFNQKKALGMTPQQQMQMAKMLYDANVKLINSTDYTLNYSDEDAINKKQEDLQNAYLKFQSDSTPVIPGGNSQYSEYLPPVPTAPPTQKATQKATKAITEKEKGWAF